MSTAPAVVEHHHPHGPANRGRRVLEAAAPLFVRFPDRLADTAVVVLHDAFGLTESVERCCRALARAGHLAVAPYFYHQTGGREFTSDRAEQATAAWAALTRADQAADVAGALDHLDRRCGIAAAATAVLGLGAAAELAVRTGADLRLGAAIGAEDVRGRGLDEETIRHLAAQIDRALFPTHHRREQE